MVLSFQYGTTIYLFIYMIQIFFSFTLYLTCLSKYTKYTFVVINVWIWILIPTVLPTEKKSISGFFFVFLFKNFQSTPSLFNSLFIDSYCCRYCCCFSTKLSFLVFYIDWNKHWNKLKQKQSTPLFVTSSFKSNNRQTNKKFQTWWWQKKQQIEKRYGKNLPFHLCRQQYFQWHLSFSNTNSFQHFRFSFLI